MFINVLHVIMETICMCICVEEREKLFDEVEREWMQKESKTLDKQETSSTDNDEEEDNDSYDESDECIVKV